MAKKASLKRERIVYSLRKKEQLIRLWERSGQTKAAFCREQGLGYFTFAGWVYKHRGKGPAVPELGKFLPVVLSEPQQRAPFACVVFIPAKLTPIPGFCPPLDIFSGLGLQCQRTMAKLFFLS